jgi:hypothetical protein
LLIVALANPYRLPVVMRVVVLEAVDVAACVWLWTWGVSPSLLYSEPAAGWQDEVLFEVRRDVADLPELEANNPDEDIEKV